MSADMLLAYAPVFEVSHDRVKELRMLLQTIPDKGIESVSGAIDFLEGGGFNSREVTYLLVGPSNEPDKSYELWVTGGLSGGDSPTEAYGHFCALNLVSPIWSKLEEWAKQDRLNKYKENK